jgi:LCP family protein required for cell wall assembly
VKTLPDTQTAPAGTPPPRRHRHWGRIVLIGIGIVVVLAAAAGVGLYKYAAHKWSNGGRPFPVQPEVENVKGPMNILVVGSDTREGLNKKDKSLPAYYPSSGQRSDTIILVHLFGDGKHAVVMSFPRDLRVQVPGYGLTKINAAYNKGAANVIKTVRDYSGLEINHYVEVNFVAFRRIVDALGGVDMCVKHSYKDPDANLFLPRAGCYHFSGDQALGFARTRKYDARGDFDRIDHQQQLIRVVLDKATSLGMIVTPWKVKGVVDAATETIIHDKDLSLARTYGLARRLQNDGPGGGANALVDFRVVPSFPKYIGGVSYVIPKQDEASALFAAIKADKWPLPDVGKTAASIPATKDVTVRVYDASGKAGVAQAIHEKLKKLGFDVKIIVKKSPVVLNKTQIWIRPGDDLKAQLVDEALTIGEVMVGGKAEVDADVTIYVGSDAAAEPSASASPG